MVKNLEHWREGSVRSKREYPSSQDRSTVCNVILSSSSLESLESLSSIAITDLPLGERGACLAFSLSSLALARAILRLSFFLKRFKSCLLRPLVSKVIPLKPASERCRFASRSQDGSKTRRLLLPVTSLGIGSGEGEGKGGSQRGTREGQGAPYMAE